MLLVNSDVEFLLFSLQGHGYVNLFRTVRLGGITDSTLRNSFVMVMLHCNN